MLVRELAYDYFTKKYKLGTVKEDNKKAMEAAGYIFGTLVYSKFRSGKFQQLKDIQNMNIGEHREIAYEVSTSDNGIDMLHAVDMVKKVTGVPTDTMKAILQHLFYTNMRYNKKLLNLSNREWYAFMINNAYKLRDDFQELSSKANKNYLQMLDIKTSTWKLPAEDFYRYAPYEKDVEVYEKNAYKDYSTAMTVSGLRSGPEQEFERYLENNDKVDWYYKNGDTGQKYLSVLYGNSLEKQYLFYPDYILKMKNGDVWIIETKGGEKQGESQNIDKQSENKFKAFKRYAEELRRIKWGFVRYRDSRPFINNTVYTEDMSSEHWHRLEDEF